MRSRRKKTPPAAPLLAPEEMRTLETLWKKLRAHISFYPQKYAIWGQSVLPGHRFALFSLPGIIAQRLFGCIPAALEGGQK